jgi:lysophospholipase L1-like esterase
MATLRTYSATVENLAALIHLRLNEASGTDAIDSASDLDGQYQGGVTLGQNGGIGNGAVRLDGSDDQIFVETLSGTITISGFGDSLIDGFGIAQPGARFTPVLEAALDARGLDATVLDHAVGGERSDDGLDRVGDDIAADPDVAIVEFGTNDAKGLVALDTVESNLRGIITDLQGADIEVLLTSCRRSNPGRLRADLFRPRGRDRRDASPGCRRQRQVPGRGAGRERHRHRRRGARRPGPAGARRLGRGRRRRARRAASE